MKRMCQILQKRCSGTIRKTWVTQALLFFLLIPALQTQANNFLQDYKLSVSMSDVSIKSAIEEVKRQTNLSFVYNELDLRDAGYVDLNFKNSDVHSVLDHILKNTRLRYDIVDDVIIIKRDTRLESNSPQTKKRTVKGVVTDDNNSPLPGVAVKVKGLNVGVATDINGRYELMVDDIPSTTLQFSFVGMKSHEEKIGSRNQIDLQMESTSTGLDEVMVVAYGTTKKEAFTGSAVSVKGDDVIRGAASKISPERALQGNVAGVRFSRGGGQPGSTAEIQIRGIGSINETTEPLYIVDGVPFSTNLQMFNPEDIESMTVLKDAAATSLYGSRASNGVVIITTKKGQAGKTKFDLTYETAWSSQAMPRELDGLYMNSKELTEYSLEAIKNKYLNDYKYLPWQENYSGYNQEVQNAAETYALRQLNTLAKIIHPDDPLDGSFDYKNLTDAQLQKYITNPRSDNWHDAIFRTGRENKVNFSARGGRETLNYYASLGYVNQKGIAKGSGFERYSGRLSINNVVNKWISFSLGESVSYATWEQNTEGTYANNPVDGMNRINPTQPIFLPDGELNPKPGFKTTTPNYIRNIDEILYRSKDLSNVTNLTVTLNFTDWLSFRTVNGLDVSYSDTRTIWTPESNDGKVTNGQISQSAEIWMNIVTSNTFNFNKNFGKHNISALVGYEAKKYKSSNLSGIGQNFTTSKLMYMDNAAVPSAVEGSESNDRLISYISKIDYNFDNKYYLSGSYRQDGTCRFLRSNRWGGFWSVSGAWNMTREDFMKSSSHWLDNLRLKLSYGTNGNQPGGKFLSQNLFSVGGKHNLNPAISVSQYGNPNLKWESSYTWNAGIDVSLWNGRLKGVVEYYNRHTIDLIDKVLVPRMSGWGSITSNEGELRNSGLEITLDSRNIQTDDFSWNTNFNISYMKSKVEKLKDDKISHPFIYKQGENMYSIYTREWVGVDPATGQGTWKLNTKDQSGNVIDPTSTTHDNLEADRVIVGKGYPDWFGGMTNTFNYKGLELSFLLTFSIGGNLWYTDHYLLTTDGYNVGNYNLGRETLGNYWTKPGDVARDPIVIYNNPYNSSANTSTRRMQSSDHLRVKTITLGYNLPKMWMKTIGLSSAKIYVNGNDVLTFSHSKYVNPEVGTSGLSKSISSWPSLKSWRVGINIQF